MENFATTLAMFGLLALWFGIHPMHVESVAWVVERKNVLSGEFYLSAVLAYLRFSGVVGAPADQPRVEGLQQPHQPQCRDPHILELLQTLLALVHPGQDLHLVAYCDLCINIQIRELVKDQVDDLREVQQGGLHLTRQGLSEIIMRFHLPVADGYQQVVLQKDGKVGRFH